MEFHPTNRELAALHFAVEQMGVDWLEGWVGEWLAIVNHAREAGWSDARILEDFIGAAHDRRWRSEVVYLISRAVIRFVVYETWDRVEAEV